MIKKLSELGTGDKALIRSFENEELYIKLMEMGIIPGEIVIVENIAPFKDPIAIQIAGYHLSLRIDEAENIIVELV